MLNKMNVLRRFGFLFLLFLLSGLQAKPQVAIPADFCISDAELKLFNLINNYRKEQKLPAVSMSKNLCFVAKLHVNDLQTNRPDVGNCNLHSWSDQGSWTECCYGRDPSNSTCMTSKPAELTSYEGKGYEIAFWESLDAVPEVVLDTWLSSTASKDLIVNSGTWKNSTWKALGVGIYKGYAVAWFGEEEDSDKSVKVCDADQPQEQLLLRVIPMRDSSGPAVAAGAKGVKYYLIISSFKEKSQAETEVKTLKGRGFKNPSVVTSEGNFRVALGEYDTREQALQAKKKLGERYQAAWVLKQ